MDNYHVDIFSKSAGLVLLKQAALSDKATDMLQGGITGAITGGSIAGASGAGSALLANIIYGLASLAARKPPKRFLANTAKDMVELGGRTLPYGLVFGGGLGAGVGAGTHMKSGSLESDDYKYTGSDIARGFGGAALGAAGGGVAGGLGAAALAALLANSVKLRIPAAHRIYKMLINGGHRIAQTALDPKNVQPYFRETGNKLLKEIDSDVFDDMQPMLMGASYSVPAGMVGMGIGGYQGLNKTRNQK